MPGSDRTILRSTSWPTTRYTVVGEHSLAVSERYVECKLVGAGVAADARFERDRKAFDVRRPADLLDIGCGGTRSSQTVCQMPVVRGYQMACGSSCQSCLPRGLARSCGSSSTSTVTVWRPDGSSAAVMSA